MKYQIVAILISLFVVSGCYMHTESISHFYFPPEAKQNNYEYHLWTKFIGAAKKAYSDKTKKIIIVGIEKGATNVFLRKYELEAASIEADVKWERKDELSITFFDFDEGVTIYDRENAHKSAKIIFILNITYDYKTGKFIESPMPEDLKRKLIRK